jgi:hypothetical protein
MERTGQMDGLRNMIIEQKVIAMIEANAKFKTSKAKSKDKVSAAAIDFFVAGEQAGESIPEAKYDDGGEQKLPAAPVERD